ncbi:MAG: glycosyltransferase family 2 protein [Oscillospiraceae bacterium]|nr:glycosyltransferase family 2 protein [Oscillospiraceae bacterium]
MPVVSVVMPAYNAEKYIAQSIRSVLEQTYRDFELIIVDDCSKDNTAEIIKTMAQQDDRIVFLPAEKNMGVSAARNRAVAHASGQWIAFLDSDDLWAPTKLEKQLALIESNPEARLTYTASGFIDDDGNPYSYIMPVTTEITYEEVFRRNLISCSSVVVEKALVEKYPFGNLNLCEDTAVWLQILKEIPCAHGLNEPLLTYRLARKSRSSNRIKAAHRLYLTYRFVGRSVPEAGWLVFRYVFYSVGKRRRIYTSAEG